jgi:hypothetical protein
VEREDEAARDLRSTMVSPALAGLLCWGLLLTIFSVPVWQFMAERKAHPGRPPQALEVVKLLPRRHRLLATEEEIRAYEKRMDEASVLTKVVLPPAQLVLTAGLGVGNRQVVPGTGGRLFFYEDYSYVFNNGFLDEPFRKKAIFDQLTDLHRQLRERGIDLVVVPVPPATVFYPESVGGPRFKSAGDTPMQNPSWGEFADEMRRRDIGFVDLTEPLAAVKRAGREPWMRFDSHWTPDGMEAAATAIAAAVRARDRERGIFRGSPAPPPAFASLSTAVEVPYRGDLCALLSLSPNQRAFPEMRLSVRQVLTPGGRPLPADPAGADVLLIGDSLSDRFDDVVPGRYPTGLGAGLPQHLARALGRPVYRLTEPTHLSVPVVYAAEQIRQHPELLRGKRVVIYEFNARRLFLDIATSWPLVDLGPAPSTATTPTSGRGG